MRRTARCISVLSAGVTLAACAFDTGDMSRVGLSPATMPPPAGTKPEIAEGPPRLPVEQSRGTTASQAEAPATRPRQPARAPETARVAEAGTGKEALRRADEAEMLARAKAEREALLKEEEDARRRAEEKRQRTLERLEAERQAELDRISARLRTREQSAESRSDPPPSGPQVISPAASERGLPRRAGDEANAPTTPTPTAGEQRREPRVSAGEPERMAVLLLMQPGSRGIRRFEKTGDPLLCVGTGCYVSQGANEPAIFLPGRKAFGFTNTMGQRAGACSRSLVCIYRDVAFDPRGAFVQPVDMRMVRHDRREGQQIAGDSRCRLSSTGALDCRRPVVGPDYRLWIVPETLARQVGARVLERALAEGLPDSQQAALR